MNKKLAVLLEILIGALVSNMSALVADYVLNVDCSKAVAFLDGDFSGVFDSAGFFVPL